MKMKLIVIVLTLSFLSSGMLVAVGSRASGAIEQGVLEKNVETMEENEPFFDVEIINYPEEVEMGDVVEIEYNVTNTGNAIGTQDIVLLVEGEEVNRTEDLTLEPGDEWDTTFTYDTGNIEIDDVESAQKTIETNVGIQLESEDDSDSEEMTVTEEVTPEIPGFTFVLLLIGGIFGVAIYHKKKQ